MTAVVVPVTKVALAVIEKDGKILIARRTGDDPLKGKWEFPVGKVEGNETPVECLKREVLEELGVRIEAEALICSTRHVYPHTSVELHAYQARIVSGCIQDREYHDINWVAPSDIVDYDFPEANQRIIDVIRSLYAALKEKRP